MNKDTVKGTMDDVAGRVKRQTGEWTGDVNKQVEGAGQQVKGKAEKVLGNIKDAAGNSNAANRSGSERKDDSGHRQR